MIGLECKSYHNPSLGTSISTTTISNRFPDLCAEWQYLLWTWSVLVSARFCLSWWRAGTKLEPQPETPRLDTRGARTHSSRLIKCYPWAKSISWIYSTFFSSFHWDGAIYLCTTLFSQAESTHFLHLAPQPLTLWMSLKKQKDCSFHLSKNTWDLL